MPATSQGSATGTASIPAPDERIAAAGEFESIVEQKDATDAERAITETNAGVYVFEVFALRTALAGIGTDNAQSEKYLTDAAAAIRSSGAGIEAVPVADPWLVAGINDRAQLSAAAA
jgi:bifunctional UDP-N-acetylglucosamine pyrophosphorylase/glucosamine-1-phosphate N-acetyltransferase